MAFEELGGDAERGAERGARSGGKENIAEDVAGAMKGVASACESSHEQPAHDGLERVADGDDRREEDGRPNPRAQQDRRRQRQPRRRPDRRRAGVHQRQRQPDSPGDEVQGGCGRENGESERQSPHGVRQTWKSRDDRSIAVWGRRCYANDHLTRDGNGAVGAGDGSSFGGAEIGCTLLLWVRGEVLRASRRNCQDCRGGSNERRPLALSLRPRTHTRTGPDFCPRRSAAGK